MVLLHEFEISKACNWSDVPTACDGQHLVLPVSKAVVGVWNMQDLTAEPLPLVGHHREISAICLGHSSLPKLVCSAASYYIIVWDIHNATQCHQRGETIKGTIVGTSLGNVQCVAFNPDDSLLAAAVQNQVLILSAKTEKLIATLEGHTALVTSVQFCPHYTFTVVSVSEDRTFKVWNVKELSLVYQSSIISGSPFISMAMNPNKEQVAIGTTDGQLRIYDMTDGNGFRCLHHLDVVKIASRINCGREEAEKSSELNGPVTVSSRPSWQRDLTQSGYDNSADETDVTERGCAILGLCYSYQGETTAAATDMPAFIQRENTTVRELLTSAPLLVVGTSTGLLQVNAFTLEVYQYWSLQNPIPSANGSGSTSVMTASSVYLTQGKQQQVWCILGSLFQNKIHILRWDLVTPQKPVSMVMPPVDASLSDRMCQLMTLSDDKGDFPGEETVITILSHAPLLENSILKSELLPKQKNGAKPVTGKGKSSNPATKKLPGSVSDQPLTFKSKVKSSGYTAAPRKGMFNPQTNVNKGKLPGKKPSPSLSDRLVMKEYPIDDGAPVHFCTSVCVAERPTPINSLTFSDDGHSLVCGLGNRAVQEFTVPLTGKGTAFTGHNGPVSYVHCSHGNHRLVSSSEDRTACLWVKSQSEPILIIDKVNNNFSAHRESVGVKSWEKENPSFSKDVRCAQFYYVDKFVLLVSGNSFYLYKYHLDSTREDIKRYLTKSRYKLVKSFQLLQAQTITTLTAVNSFHSYVTMAAGSDRSVNIYDLNEGRISRVMTDVHTKHCHVICLNEGSSAVSHPPSVYDLFVTAAMTDSIKLWDIRTNRCVRRYEGHQNRCYPCGLALSPCGRFLATGAEDKSAYIYDLRAGAYLHKMTGHTDVVSDVAFHPIKPQLVTACLDGKVRVFTTAS
ncbi:WD repeat-containing protein 27-like isoform X2 [Liolophura sinensis]|uniref:WD repeat-containing protein 27-like isoform X2 n=1 Tax=Liolophura sinensis TaxID=3198878 RepID=UPI0031588C5B